MVELVDTLVLEASTSVCEFESRLGYQIRKCGRVWLKATVLKTVVSKGTVSSNLTVSANFYLSDVNGSMSVSKTDRRGSNPWGDANYCESGEMVYSRDLKSLVERHAGSSPASRTIHKGDVVCQNKKMF